MNYKTLKRAARTAVCNTIGGNVKGFATQLRTCNPNEGIELEGFDLGTGIELFFDEPPFDYFSSNIVFYVNLDSDGQTGDVQAFFGSACRDVATAEAAAEEFLDRDEADGWYIEDEFDEVSGLHLMRTFSVDPNNYADVFSKITACFAELCNADMTDALCAFLPYFED